jgi:hypothetical protein
LTYQNTCSILGHHPVELSTAVIPSAEAPYHFWGNCAQIVNK